MQKICFGIQTTTKLHFISQAKGKRANVLQNVEDNLLQYLYTKYVNIYYPIPYRIKETGIGKRTFGEMRLNVAQIAASLKQLGVGIGDRVAGYMPNCPEAIEIMAATASIGAIWSSTSPDFGISGVLDRFQQISPKVLFSVEAVGYNAKVCFMELFCQPLLIPKTQTIIILILLPEELF